MAQSTVEATIRFPIGYTSASASSSPVWLPASHPERRTSGQHTASSPPETITPSSRATTQVVVATRTVRCHTAASASGSATR